MHVINKDWGNCTGGRRRGGRQWDTQEKRRCEKREKFTNIAIEKAHRSWETFQKGAGTEGTKHRKQEV